MDLIKRQAAIDVVEKYDFNFPKYMERFVTELRDAMKEDLKEDIARLPSAQQWIPFGAPMNSGQHYLVTLRQKFEGEETYRVRIMRLHEGHWLYPHHFPEWINDEMEQEVVAWMPLPEPWKGGPDEH